MKSRRLKNTKILPIIIIYSFCANIKTFKSKMVKDLTTFFLITYIAKNLSCITCTAFSASLRSTSTDILISLVEIMLMLMPAS